MPFSDKARDPNRPYLVYAFAWRMRIFYIGLAGQDGTRHTHRWKFVQNLVRHEEQGTLTPDKRVELFRASNAVIRALVRSGVEPIDTVILWEGIGRTAALEAETLFLEAHRRAGTVLANIHGMDRPHSVEEVLQYLRAPSEA